MDLRDPIGLVLISSLACGRTELVIAPANGDVPGTGGSAGRPQDGWPRGITRVSVSSTGEQGNGISTYSRISDDASRVVFVSRADDFFAKPAAGSLELVVHDRRAKTTTRVCESTGVVAIPPALTTDGELVGFTLPDAAGIDQGVLCDVAHGAPRVLAGQVGDPISYPQLSADGRVTAYETVDRVSSFGHRVVVRDLTTLEEAQFGGARLPWGYAALSADATKVLVITDQGLVFWERFEKSDFLVAPGAEGDINFPGMSGDGRWVTFSTTNAYVADDTNGTEDVYLFDVVGRRFERISVGSGGANSDGRSLSPCISRDGRFVTYASDATNLVDGDTNYARDIFVFDRVERTTVRVNLTDDGSQGNANCHLPSISDDGRAVAFSCEASNMVPNDTNDLIDVFVVDR